MTELFLSRSRKRRLGVTAEDLRFPPVEGHQSFGPVCRRPFLVVAPLFCKSCIICLGTTARSRRWTRSSRRNHYVATVREHCQMSTRQRVAATDSCVRSGLLNHPTLTTKISGLRHYHAGGVMELQGNTVLFGAKIMDAGTPVQDASDIISARCARRCTGGNMSAPHHLYVRKQRVTLRHNGFSPRKIAFNLGGLP